MQPFGVPIFNLQYDPCRNNFLCLFSRLREIQYFCPDLPKPVVDGGSAAAPSNRQFIKIIVRLESTSTALVYPS